MNATRRVVVLLTSLLMLVASSVVNRPGFLGGGQALAYAPQGNVCADRSISWRFSNEFVNWTETKKTWVRDAINTLDGARDHDGTKLVTVTEEAISSAVDVQLIDVPLRDAYGGSECAGTPSIWINANGPTAAFYYKVARHEMFHLAGAEHGGEMDSFDGVEVSTMSTCINYQDFPASNVFEQDGHAYENWLWSSLAERQFHANVGFEQGFRFWGKTAGTITTYSSGGATGPGYVGWQSSDTGDFVFQTVRTVNGSLSSVYRAVGNARSPGSNWTTRVRVSLARRNVDFPNDPNNPNGCDYPGGIVNPNGWPSVSSWVVFTETAEWVTVPASWTRVDSEWMPLPQQEGYDLRVRLRGTAVNAKGNYGQVRIDNLRGEWND